MASPLGTFTVELFVHCSQLLCYSDVSLRRIHPPFQRAVTQGGQGGAPWRSLGLGCAFRLRWPRQGRRSRWGAWARRGCDSGARRDDTLVRSVVVPSILQIAGGDRQIIADRGAQRHGRAWWQCLRFAIRPSVALTQRLRVHLQTDDRARDVGAGLAASVTDGSFLAGSGFIVIGEPSRNWLAGLRRRSQRHRRPWKRWLVQSSSQCDRRACFHLHFLRSSSSSPSVALTNPCC
jgi:hypothetical protein